jgi:hypothetical protein
MVNPVRHTVTVGGREFLLIPGQEVAAVKVAVVDALKAGADLLIFRSQGTEWSASL